ncbi:hypothetical protein K431DRAFT_10123 [Polychaeton citri CBS 116435]|uniref:LYC1 C-terminal domain-containing protein n=1 Tax=Polychaeton citri CBS 116435 TaxID=1314669 RepID=A0A9P4USR1_9PEZI|nr:hypothetical protein K431DRAFT_10123 [Polychaeton citri CBS 116435]
MGSIQDLPDGKSPDISLVVSTPEEVREQTLANSVEWRGALNLEAYLRREARLGQQDMAKDGGLTPWSLVYQLPGSKQRQVLSGCETFRKTALVAKDGKVEACTAHGVCSVFCPSEYRGKGYAGRMMRELGPILRRWQTDGANEAKFSVLYSDIGKKFYAARGWYPFPSTHLAVPTSALANATTSTLPSTQPLESKDLPELCTLDERTIRQRLAKQDSSGKTTVALIPDYRTMAWHHAREDFIAEDLFQRSISVRGAITGESGKRVWCYWTRVWPNPSEGGVDTLHILRLGIEDLEFSDFHAASNEQAGRLHGIYVTRAVAALFTAALTEAKNWGMKQIQLWNPTSTSLAASRILDKNVLVEHREEESITSLQWYGEGNWQDVDWLCNEKYGWC